MIRSFSRSLLPAGIPHRFHQRRLQHSVRTIHAGTEPGPAVSTAVGVLLLMLIVGDAFAIYMCWRQSDATLVRRMLPAGIGGALIGSYLLAALSPNALRVALAIFVLLGVAYKFASDQIKQLAYQPRRWHALAMGALGGVASGTFNKAAHRSIHICFCRRCRHEFSSRQPPCFLPCLT
jgi:hypothetical protein